MPEPGLLIALSGGPDSVALLRMAKIWADLRERPLAAAHLNHRLRGSQADADARFCADLCEQLSIRFILNEEDPRPLARSRGAGIEEAARILRHDFFRNTLSKNNDLHCTATGHHHDDQVETVVMRLFRGTGPDGMAGIRPLAGSVIHPLLQISRSEILTWLENINQPWRTDPSNLDGDNTRSRLRRELMPVVRSIFGEGANATPARLAGLWESDLNFLEQLTRDALSGLTQEQNGTKVLSVDQLCALHPALAARVLRLWLIENSLINPSRLESVHLMNILVWLREGTSGTTLDLPDGCRLKRDFDGLSAEKSGTETPPMRNAGDFRILVASIQGPDDPVSFGRSEGHGRPCGPESWNLTCPSNVLKGNLKVRNWRQGDRIQPFGLDGSRKLSDLFREQRLPASERSGVLVVEDDTGILWTVGLARAERTRLLQPGQSAVTITVALRAAISQSSDTNSNTGNDSSSNTGND